MLNHADKEMLTEYSIARKEDDLLMAIKLFGEKRVLILQTNKTTLKPLTLCLYTILFNQKSVLIRLTSSITYFLDC